MNGIRIAALGIVLLSTTASARTWHVPKDVPTIPAAMDSATTGDSILVGPGKHILQALNITNGVILTSEQGPLVTEITGSPFGLPNHGAFFCVGLTDYTEISGFYIHGYVNGLIGDFSSTIWVSRSQDVCIKNNIIGSSWWAIHVTDFPVRVVIENNTLYAGNLDFGSGGAFFLELKNNIIWGPATISATVPTISCNNFKNPADIPSSGVGDFSADPLFCAASSGAQQYSLDANSPCAPANSGSCGLVGAIGVACAVPVEAATWGRVKAMFLK